MCCPTRHLGHHAAKSVDSCRSLGYLDLSADLILIAGRSINTAKSELTPDSAPTGSGFFVSWCGRPDGWAFDLQIVRPETVSKRH